MNSKNQTSSWILGVDIGNTNISLALFSVPASNPYIPYYYHSPTDALNSIEAWKDCIHQLLLRSDPELKHKDIQGLIYSSVVPALTSKLKENVALLLPHLSRRQIDRGELGYNSKYPFALDYPNPSEIGVDRLVNTSAAVSLYTGDMIIVDMGTANTLNIIHHLKDGELCPDDTQVAKPSSLPARRSGAADRRSDTSDRRSGTADRRSDILEGHSIASERRSGMEDRRSGMEDRRSDLDEGVSIVSDRRASEDERRSGSTERRTGDIERRLGAIDRRSGSSEKPLHLLERRAGILSRRAGPPERRIGATERRSSRLRDSSVKEHRFTGGIIAPGIYTAMQNLTDRAARLTGISLLENNLDDLLTRGLGKNTQDAMFLGFLLHARGSIAQSIQYIREKNPERNYRVLGTGGALNVLLESLSADSEQIELFYDLFDSIEPLLTLKGLQALYSRFFLR